VLLTCVLLKRVLVCWAAALCIYETVACSESCGLCYATIGNRVWDNRGTDLWSSDRARGQQLELRAVTSPNRSLAHS
jgi:hypothetical protein